MKAVMLMFDSLNRHMLPMYGADWTQTPNFKRLAQRTVTFDNSWVCSMPCMPARRDFHTGRPNFLHTGWGPLEPWDDSVPQMLHKAGVHTHLATDHYHYFEDGGATYHTRYETYEFYRGQEGDPFYGLVGEPPAEGRYGRNATSTHTHGQDAKNRTVMTREEDQPQTKTIQAGIDFMRRNRNADRWMLHIETFDPHEPFFTQRKYKDQYADHFDNYEGPVWDWPPYSKVTEPREMVDHMQYEYASLLTMCDTKLGDVLDTFDELDLWDDTMLIVWTDHGFMLGEHDCWAKCWQPFYSEIAHTPFFMWDPRSGKRGEHRSALVQPAIDLGPTLLRYFDLEPTEHMLGHDLAEAVANDTPVREAAIFGLFGAHVNVTDGQYVYMRGPTGPTNTPLHEYTLMPTAMKSRYDPSRFEGVELANPFSFMHGCRPLRLTPPLSFGLESSEKLPTLLFDIEADPGQDSPLTDAAAESRMIDLMTREMARCDCPAEQYERLGVPLPG